MTPESLNVAKEITIAIIQKHGVGTADNEKMQEFGKEVAKLYLTVSKAVKAAASEKFNE